jgi:O-antigen ligase
MMSRVMAKTHSNAERELDYALTWAHITSTPWLFLFGQGTQIDVPQLRIPLGSHSTFLGLWFKQGLLGLFLFYAMGSRAVLASRLALFETRDPDDRWFARMVMTSTVFTLCQGAFVEIDVDASYCALWWVIVGLSLAHLAMLREEREDLPVAADPVAAAVRGRLPVGPRPLPAPGYPASPRANRA